VEGRLGRAPGFGTGVRGLLRHEGPVAGYEPRAPPRGALALSAPADDRGRRLEMSHARRSLPSESSTLIIWSTLWRMISAAAGLRVRDVGSVYSRTRPLRIGPLSCVSRGT